MSIIEVLGCIVMVLGMFVVTLILWAKVIRLFKIKSHHHLIPPKPSEDRNHYPIKMSNYISYIFIENADYEDILRVLKNPFKKRKTSVSKKIDKVSYAKIESWHILRLDNSSFFLTKILPMKLNYKLENEFSDVNIIGFCKHKYWSSKDYAFKIDEESDDDYLIGTFRNGKNFGVYIPDVDISGDGNMSLSMNKEVYFNNITSKLPIYELNQYFLFKELELD